jgi:amino acid transporter
MAIDSRDSEEAMFGIMSLHTLGEIMKYALVWAATLALGPALALTTGLLAFMMLPAVFAGLPFVVWAFLGPEKREAVHVAEEYPHARAHAHLTAHAHVQA